MTETGLVPTEQIETLIHTIRGQRVMLAADLAALYGVETKVLNQAVKRNPRRFPTGFMFQLTLDEWAALRSQIVTLAGPGRHPKYLPYAFTEHGAVMLASVLNSDRAIAASIIVVQAFVQLRRAVADYADLLARVERLESIAIAHDDQLREVFDALRALLALPERPERQIGFRLNEGEGAADR